MRGQVLVLITALVASVAASPIPNSPLSVVERAEQQIAGEADDAILPSVLDNVKRTLLDRLEEIIPVKRASIDDYATSDDYLKKRDSLGVPAGGPGKRDSLGVPAGGPGKRDSLGVPAGGPGKRDSLGVPAGGPGKRDSLGVPAGGPGKRDSLGVPAGGPGKRDSLGVPAGGPGKL